ncbi:NHLP leader peptide family RiPP precursor [Caenimonas terrae]|uniref:NHLP leader peptide family RiPP n=1 Tax=Caenimonas terrae TaxID=696074 RepID=A0ABW0N8D1_9BURK
MNQEEQSNKIGALLAKCWSDKSFKQKLLSDTAATLKAEGIEIPAGYTINVMENTNTVLNFVIPPNPNGELSDLELEAVAGGKGSAGQITGGLFESIAGVATLNTGLIADGGNRIQPGTFKPVSFNPFQGW